ncbi:unnamed protein product [Closterium sp. Yama58-4]|nr:unnamed protein product [Closterium sp. Yama58-4]
MQFLLLSHLHAPIPMLPRPCSHLFTALCTIQQASHPSISTITDHSLLWPPVTSSRRLSDSWSTLQMQSMFKTLDECALIVTVS